MNEQHALDRAVTALRDLDPASTTLDTHERRRAGEIFARIVSTPHDEPLTTAAPRRQRRARVIAALGLTAMAAVLVPTALTAPALASWTATPAPLSPADAEAAASTCRAASALDASSRLVIGERRGGWVYVLLEGTGEAKCLMPDDQIGTGGDVGFFGSFDPDPPAAPTPASDGLIEHDSQGGSMSVRGRVPLTTTKEWVYWVNGFVGRDVVAVTVQPDVGPKVEASVVDGRYSAWWPAGPARGDNPGISAGWTYTVTLTDGTTRQVIR